ncbi:Leo1-like protein-domain-containing protein [Jackrogersella minutella]|nr:Leo1-like protein-domain-containing protein [Jackrogersella minutella]
MSDSDEGGDLFGDEAPSYRVLSDQELGSDLDDGDDRSRTHSRNRDRDDDRDEDNNDNDNDNGDEDQEVKVKRIMGVNIHRHRIPRTSKDGTGSLQTLKVPSFLKLQAEEYKPDTFEPTEWDIQNVRSDKRQNVVRFTRDPETGELRSNAIIYRWSDGSLTMSVGAEQYEVRKKSMAPSADRPYYEERDDAHYYVAAAHFTSELFMTVGHVNEQYSINPPSNLKDEAVLKFSRAMEEAARTKRQGANMIFTTTKDPELQKREAEAAEKERMKAQRRRENASARIDGRSAPTGSGGYRAGGLSIGDLEGGRRTSGARKRVAPGSSKGKRRRPEYDSDDDFASGSRRQNEYDREDDFIAPSDDEEGGDEEDEEDEDLLDDDEEEEVPRKKRQKTAEAEEDADADADADLDDVDMPAESSHRRRRHIIDDEEEE